MWNKQTVLKEAIAKGHCFIDESRMIYFKEIDYTGNPLAPERKAYRFYYWDIFGKRHKYSFWPNTVGFQSMR